MSSLSLSKQNMFISLLFYYCLPKKHGITWYTVEPPTTKQMGLIDKLVEYKKSPANLTYDVINDQGGLTTPMADAQARTKFSQRLMVKQPQDPYLHFHTSRSQSSIQYNQYTHINIYMYK